MAMLGNPISTMDFPVDYFTGDGTSTTFQLSRIPASATSILVHIGGVKQVASTTDPAYYLDGSQLVFASAPGAYSPIEVNYLGIAGQVNIPGTQSVTQDMLSLQLANTFVYQTTANGATASFTLNAPPVSANSLVVSANGVVQYDYSVNGNTLTFGFTPPAGTFIRATSLALAQAGVPSDGSVTSVKLGANLTITGNTTFDGFSGAPARIRGDMSNATLSNRLSFQTSTTNSSTAIQAIPNGTGSSSSLALYGSTDTANTARAIYFISSSEASLRSDATGSGTYLPLTMFTGGSERMRIDTSGNLLLGNTTSFTSTTVAGALKMDGYGVYPYLNTSGVTNTAVVSGLTYQNSTPYAGDNGATSTTMVAALVQARLSNSGAGGSNSINIQAGNFGTVITDVAAAARINGLGISGAAVRNISTDVSTNVNNALTGVTGSVNHGITAGAGIVTGTALAGTFNATNLNGTMTVMEGLRSGVNIASATTSLSASSTNAAGLRIATTVGAASGGPGTVSSLFGLITQGPTIGVTGTVTSYYGVYIDSPVVSGTLTNRYGVWQNDASSINYFAGNVGIGTSSPAFKLSVNGTTSTYIAAISTNAGSGSGLYTANATNAYYIGAGAASGGSSLEFRDSTNSATRMVITSSGDVGIGTISPGSGIRLDVLGGEIRAGRVDTSSEGGQVSFSRASDNATGFYLDVYGSTSTPSFRLVDVSSGAVDLTVNSSGAVALRGGVSATGVGITFPASQSPSSDANTLDDYEEGTFTATFTAATTAPTTPITTTGTYVKIGNQVTITFGFSNVDTTGASGSLLVTGMPFAAHGTIPTVAGSPMLYSLPVPQNYNVWYITGTVLNLYSVGNAAGWAPVNISAGTGKYVWSTITYIVA